MTAAKQPLPGPLVPWPVRVAWGAWGWLTWPWQAHQLRREGWRRTGWMEWQAPEGR